MIEHYWGILGALALVLCFNALFFVLKSILDGAKNYSLMFFAAVVSVTISWLIGANIFLFTVYLVEAMK